jgi:hypothetical protein
MAIHYAQIVMDTPELRPILRVWHLHKLLRAHIALARGGSTFPARSENVAAWIEWFIAQGHEHSVPNKYALNTAFGLCRRCGDMSSALRIARTTLEGPVRGSELTAKAWVDLLRLAIVAPPNDKRQCLELLARHHSVLDVWESSSAIEQSEKKDHVSLAHCIVRVLRTPLALSDPDAAGGLDPTDAGKSKTWSKMRRRAELFLETAHR